MSDFKKGDRVRVTIEGTVIRDQASPDVFLSADKAAGLAHHVVNTTKPGVTIEKVADPLPTTPGSVIISRDGYTRLLHDDGTWHGRFTGTRGVAPDDLDAAQWGVLLNAAVVEP